MKSFMRNALLGAAGLVALALPANAAGSTAVADTSQVNAKATLQQLAQRPYDPSADSVGFKRSEQLAQRRDDPSAGSVGFKKSKKKAKK
jgi:hypothetical protein